MIYAKGALKELENDNTVSIVLSLRNIKSLYSSTFEVSLDKLPLNANELSQKLERELNLRWKSARS